MSDKYNIAETESFQKLISKVEFKRLYIKIKDFIYPQLSINPFYGKNIKKLKGSFEGFYRYRIGNYRLFYKIDQKVAIVLLVTLKKREDAYK